MKVTFTSSLIFSITVIVIGNKDDHFLNLRGAHHSHGDDNELSGDVQVSRLLNVSIYSDEADIDDYYDDGKINKDNEYEDGMLDNNDDDRDDNDDYYDDNIEGDDDNGRHNGDDDYYDDDQIDDVNGGHNNDDSNDNNEIGNDGRDEDYENDKYYDNNKINSDGVDEDYDDDDDETNDVDGGGGDYSENLIGMDQMKPETNSGLIKKDGVSIDNTDGFGNVAGIENGEDDTDFNNCTRDSDGPPNEDNIRSQQIRNYRDGNALLINVHITHHGGTTFCHNMRNLGATPAHACNGGDNWNFDVPHSRHRPWTFNETSEYIPIVRKHFHMIGWEFGFKPHPPLSETDWENPLLVSVLIVRDPIDRLFGGSSLLDRQYGHSNKRNQTAWWEYAQLDQYTDNFALHKLTPKHCPSGKDTPLKCLEAAQDLVKRFTFVIDIACLDESMAVLAEQLDWILPPARPHHVHPGAAERFGNATLHNWLRQKNRRDIELYEWAKHRAVLNCSALP